MTRVVIYALGGGHGHAVRGSALGAALERHGAAALVLVPESKVAVARALGAEPRGIERTTNPAALAAQIDAALVEHDAAHLVIDVFPEGLLDELSALHHPAVRTALLRCRTDASQPRLHRGLERCTHAMDLEPHLGWCPKQVPAEPFGPVTRPLRPAEPRADVLVLGAEPELQSFAGTLGSRLQQRGVRVAWIDGDGLHGLPSPPGELLPAEVLGARVVVGPAGFNLSYELRALGCWHVALPRPRPFDDQHRRARALARTVGSPQAAERLVLRLLQTPPPIERRPAIRTMDELASALMARWHASPR